MPAATIGFLQKLLEHSPDADRDCLPWCQAVHSLVKGLGVQILQGLPGCVLLKFQELVRDAVSSTDFELQLLSLILLDHFSAFDTTSGAGKTHGPGRGHAKPWHEAVAASCQRFLTDHAHTTLDMVIAGCTSCCSTYAKSLADESSKANESRGRALSRLMLGVKICLKIPLEVRTQWSDKSILKTCKFAGKIEGLKQDPSLQSAAAQLAVSVQGGHKSSNLSTSHIQAILTSSVWTHSNERSIGVLAPAITTDFVQDALDQTVQILGSRPSFSLEDASSLAKNQNMLRNISGSSSGDRAFVRFVAAALAGTGLKKRIQSCLKEDPASAPLEHGAFGVQSCPGFICVARYRLKTQLPLFLTENGLFDSAQSNADTDVALTAVRWLACRPALAACNNEAQPPDQPTKAECLMAMKQSPKPGCSFNWQHTLQNEIHEIASRQFERIAKMVSSICKDYAQRCDGHETPLLQNQTRLIEAERQRDELLAQLRKAKATICARDLSISEPEVKVSGLDESKSKLVAKLFTQEGETAKEVDLLRHKLQDCQESTRNQMNLASERAKHEYFSCRADLVGKEQQLENQGKQLADINAALEETRSLNSRLHIDIKELATRFQIVTNEKQQLVSRVKGLQKSLDEHGQLKAALEKDFAALQAQAQQDRAKVQAQVQELKENIQSLESDQAEERQRHLCELQSKTATHKECVQKFKHTETTLRSEIRILKEKHALRETDLAKRLDAMNRVNDFQAAELAMFYELRSQLIGVGSVHTLRRSCNPSSVVAVNHEICSSLGTAESTETEVPILGSDVTAIRHTTTGGLQPLDRGHALSDKSQSSSA